jgi:CheY-like chemotaxis protein/HPt (histidine-containing phosphotransfer) domain-containing protein
MTSLKDAPDGVTAANVGVVATLSKPVHRDDLVLSLRMALLSEVLREVPVTPPVVSSRERLTGRLLLAEDNLINQKVAIAMLSSAGYVVDTVLDGAAAVRLAAENRYDAILMDCQMPEMNGYEATAAIRANEGTARHTPIIAMTAGARREDRDRCLAEGMDSYLSKPVGKDALLALVARFVHQAAATLTPPEAGAGASEAATINPVMLQEMRVAARTVESGFLTDLVRQFVEDTEPLLVRLGAAFDAGDAETVGRIAHDIRRNGDQLGGRKLVLSCSRLETKAVSGWLGADGRHDLQAVEIDYHDLRRKLTENVVHVASGSGASDE